MFKKSLTLSSIALCLSLNGTSALSSVLIEDFEDVFPAWENNWLAMNSNLKNYLGQGADRSTNVDGLWLDDGDSILGNDNVEIVFNSTFGSTLGSISFDLTTYVQGISLEVYDISDNIILSSALSVTRGATSDPGIYESFSVSSTNGIKGFTLFTNGNQIEGFTSIDNVSVSTIPVPAAAWLFATGLIGLASVKKKK